MLSWKYMAVFDTVSFFHSLCTVHAAGMNTVIESSVIHIMKFQFQDLVLSLQTLADSEIETLVLFCLFTLGRSCHL